VFKLLYGRKKRAIGRKILLGMSVVGTIIFCTPLNAQNTPQNLQTPQPIYNQAEYSYEIEQPLTTSGVTFPRIVGGTTTLQATTTPEVAPFRILGCRGETLSNYGGFRASLLTTTDRGLTLGGSVALPVLPVGVTLEPNSANVNPYLLASVNGEGRYGFALTRSTQLTTGQQYVIVLSPPAAVKTTTRRILIEILGTTGDDVRMRWTAIDGLPLVGNGATVQEITTATRNGAANDLGVIGATVSTCDDRPLTLVKSADRTAAEPGDTIAYRLVLRNTGTTEVVGGIVTDTLPLGFQLQPQTVLARKENGGTFPLTIQQNGSQVTMSLGENLLPGQSISIVYGATLSTDAVRGTGQNRAIVSGTRLDNGATLTDGPVVHNTIVRSGILQDTGTIVGRVFVDKNFDGEQQPNEPGIPNAAVYLDDGNRVTTDANGLFSVRALAVGARTGVLDLNSLPGYTLAPNRFVLERNSVSRLVRLSPGGLVRMNFGVTPTARGR
jgi:uncharacterized repeat protein (TIGR01451 family)